MSSTAASGVHTLNIRVRTLLLLVEQTGPDSFPFPFARRTQAAHARGSMSGTVKRVRE